MEAEFVEFADNISVESEKILGFRTGYLPTSAKTTENVLKTFEMLIKEILAYNYFRQ